ncbi:MAG: CDP-alcohol phosphatidyltransferase family protein [Clostridia bacterium]|nr:CDP-alcohol phosphatidyltransferase family protein [Clostridia bacterium]
MIGFYNYTVYMTFLGLVSSAYGLVMAATGHPLRALAMLMLSGVCDMFDGKIARTRKNSTDEEKRFGVQLDSLSDIVCFGALPAAIGAALLPSGTAAWIRVVSAACSCLLVLCALIRLAYFNVKEEERQKTTNERRTSFIGLPVTTSALIFPLAFALSRVLPGIFSLLIYPFAMLVTAILFISPINVRKAHGVGLVILSAIGAAEIAFIAWAVLRR